LAWHCRFVLCFNKRAELRACGAALWQTDDICADFEKRLKAIVPSAGGGGGTGRGPAGSALAACAVAQAQTGSLILAATGALQEGPAAKLSCPADARCSSGDQARRSRADWAVRPRSCCVST
jgi:hypothetical protein